MGRGGEKGRSGSGPPSDETFTVTPSRSCGCAGPSRPQALTVGISTGSVAFNGKLLGYVLGAYVMPRHAGDTHPAIEIAMTRPARLSRSFRRQFYADPPGSSLALLGSLRRAADSDHRKLPSAHLSAPNVSSRFSSGRSFDASYKPLAPSSLRRWWGNAVRVDACGDALGLSSGSCSHHFGSLRESLLPPTSRYGGQDTHSYSEKDRRLASLIDVLEAVSQQIVRADEQATLAPLLAALRNACSELLSADLASLFLKFEDRGSQYLWTVLDNGREVTLSVNEGLAGACARSKETIFVEDAYEDSRFNQRVDSATGYRTRGVMCVPVMGSSNDELLGVLQVVNKRSHSASSPNISFVREQTESDANADASHTQGSGFGETDERVLKGFAFLATVAISSAQQLQAEREARARYDSLSRLSRHLLSNFDLRAIQAAVRKEGPQLVAADRAHLLLLDAQGGVLWTQVGEHPAVLPLWTDEPNPVHASLLASVVIEEQRQVIQDAARDPSLMYDESIRLGLRSTTGVLRSIGHSQEQTTTSCDDTSINTSTQSGQRTPSGPKGSIEVTPPPTIAVPESSIQSELNSKTTTDDWQGSSQTEPHAVLACPMMNTRGRGAVGVMLATRDHSNARAFDEEDIELFEALARYTASAVSNAAAFASTSSLPRPRSTNSEEYLYGYGSTARSARSAEVASASPLSLAVPRTGKYWTNSCSKEHPSEPRCNCDPSSVEEELLAELDECPDERVLHRKLGDEAVSWDFNPLDRFWMDQQLKDLSIEIIRSWDLERVFMMPSNTLESFVSEMASRYKSNQFHNFAHAVSVLQASHMILKQLDAASRRKFSRTDALALLLAAIAHDVGHPGTTNYFQTNSLSPLAIKYNDTSVLEHHHCSLAFELLLKRECNILAAVPRSIFTRVRRSICAMVLGTDLACHDKQLMQLSTNVTSAEAPCKSDAEKDILLSSILHAADLSNPLRPFEVSLRWAKLLAAEFMEQTKLEHELGLPATKFMENGFSLNNEIFFVSGFCLPFWDALACALPGLKHGSSRVHETLERLRQAAAYVEEQQKAAPSEAAAQESASHEQNPEALQTRQDEQR